MDSITSFNHGNETSMCSFEILRNKKKITSMSEIRFLQSYLMRRFNLHTVFSFFRFTLCRAKLLFDDRPDGNLKRINSALSLYSHISGSEEVIRVSQSSLLVKKKKKQSKKVEGACVYGERVEGIGYI